MAEIVSGEDARGLLRRLREEYWIRSVKYVAKENKIDQLQAFLQEYTIIDGELEYLKRAYEKGKLDREQLVCILRYFPIDTKTIQENFPEIDSKELLKPEEVLKRYLKGEIEEDYFNSRREINKKNRDSILQALDEETIIDLMKTNKKLKRLKPTEEELKEFYFNGKISGNALIELAKGNRISQKMLLEVFARDKNGKEVSETGMKGSTNKLKIEQLLDFYDAKVLLNLLESEEINGKFVENFNKNINTQSENEQQNKAVGEYFKRLVQDIYENKQNNQQEENIGQYEIIQLYLKRIIPVQYLQEIELNEDIIFNMCVDKKLNDDNIFQLFNFGIISKEIFEAIVEPDKRTDTNLVQAVKDGTLNYRAIPLLDKSIIPELILNGEINSGLIIESYLDDNGIEIQDVVDIFKNIQLTGIDFSEFIYQGANVEKIKQLYSNLIIEESVLINLLERNIISNVQYEEIKKDENKEYEEIFGKEEIKVAEQPRKNGTTKSNGKLKNKKPQATRKFDLAIMEELFRALNVDERAITIIGKNNSISGYKVRGFKDLGLVLLEKLENSGNRIYLMTVHDAAFLLNEVEKKEIIYANETNITKKKIIDLKGIEKLNACPNMVENILNAMERLINKSNQRESTKSQKFKNLRDKEEISFIVELIHDTYERGKRGETK